MLQPEEPVKRSFWNTTMGVITKITAFLTAITALVIAYREFTNVVTPSSGGSGTITTISTTGGATTAEPGTSNDTGGETTKTEESKPNVTISAFSFQPSEITLDEDAKPKQIDVIVEANNSGNAIATQCMFTLEADKGTLQNATSQSFSLEPDKTKLLHILALVSTSANIKARLDCSNDVSKETSSIPVTVWGYGMRHPSPKF